MHETDDNRQIAERKALVLGEPLEVVGVPAVVIVKLLDPLRSVGMACIGMAKTWNVMQLRI